MNDQERVQIVAGTSLDRLQTTLRVKIDRRKPDVRFQCLPEVDASFVDDMRTQPAFRSPGHDRTIWSASAELQTRHAIRWPGYDRAIEAASAGRARARAGPDAGHKDIRTIVRDAAGSKFLRGYRLENIPARPALSDIDREAECSLTFAELSDLDREGARLRRLIAGLKCPFDMAGMRS